MGLGVLAVCLGAAAPALIDAVQVARGAEGACVPDLAGAGARLAVGLALLAGGGAVALPPSRGQLRLGLGLAVPPLAVLGLLCAVTVALYRGQVCPVP